MVSLISFLFISLQEPAWNDHTQDQNFNFYLGEFVENKLDEFHPLQVLIEERLAESIFDTNSSKVLKKRIELIQKAFRQYPDALLRFERLDQKLRHSFEDRLAKAKRVRWIAATGGAVIGALIAIPVGRSLTSSLGSKVMYLAVPVGALAGGGLGFLLADLTMMPDYKYEDFGVATDLETGLADIEAALEGEQ